MAESVLTKKIKVALYKYSKAHLQGVYGAFEVVMGSSTCGYGHEFVDFVTMDSDNVFRCYEVKVSVEDLHSKALLSFYGDFNFVVVPDEKLAPGLLGEALGFVTGVFGNKVGVLVYHELVDGTPYFSVASRAKRQNVRIEQRIANMHNMVRSGSRYTTKYVKSLPEFSVVGSVDEL